MGSSSHDYAGNAPDITSQQTEASAQPIPVNVQPYPVPAGAMPPNFLPSDPRAMATGLTPEMMASIAASSAPQAPAAAAAAAAPEAPAPPANITMEDIAMLSRFGAPGHRGNYTRMGMELVGQPGTPENRQLLASIINRASRDQGARWGQNA